MEGKEEFVKLINEHEGIIFKITRAYTRTKEEQKDLYQDVVFQLWKSYSSFRNESKPGTWIYRVALNTCLTHDKKVKRSGTTLPLEFEIVQYDDDHNVKEQIDLMYAHIGKLNEIERGILLLFLENKSHSEIAEITGFTVSNIGTKLSRIKNKLKNKIKEQGHGTR